MAKIVFCYADGGCRGNGHANNIGAWGVVLNCDSLTKELYGAVKNTTNNIMELTSCIEGLKAIKNKSLPVIVTTDSKYVVEGINSWLKNWIKNNWLTKAKKPIANKELWEELLKLKLEFTDITFVHCAGHANNKGNNRADQLVNIAMDEVIV